MTLDQAYGRLPLRLVTGANRACSRQLLSGLLQVLLMIPALSLAASGSSQPIKLTVVSTSGAPPNGNGVPPMFMTLSAMDVELPAGQTQIVKTFSLPVPNEYVRSLMEEGMPLTYETVVNVSRADSNGLPMDVTIQTEWGEFRDSPFPMDVDGEKVWLEDDDERYLNVFHDYLMDDSNTYSVGLRVNNPKYKSINYRPFDEESRITVTLRQRSGKCVANVGAKGDVSGVPLDVVDFGDLAYYNDFLKPGNRYAEQGGVYRATGSAADPTAQKVLKALIPYGATGDSTTLPAMVFTEEEGSVIEPGGVYDPFCEDGTDTSCVTDPPPAADPSDQYESTMDEFYGWIGGKDEVANLSDLETFGLTLATRKIANTPDQKVNQAMGIAQFVSAMTVEAATTEQQLNFDPETEAFTGRLPLSRLEFTAPGGARFVWKKDDPGADSFGENKGFALMELTQNSGGMIAGWIWGVLYSHTARRPDGSDSSVEIYVFFAAAEGAFNCDLPGMNVMQ